VYEIEVLVASLLLHPKIEGLSLGKFLACVAYSKTLINHEQYCFVFRKERPVQEGKACSVFFLGYIYELQDYIKSKVVRLIEEKH